ncbi:glycosyltransferase [bacterium]|nr:glycosyltransferase [bacterium]
MTVAQVVHLTPALFGHNGVYGGGERYAYELARHMARVVPTTLVAFGDTPQRFSTPDGLQVRVIGPAWKVRGQRSNPFHLSLFPIVATTDVVHAHQTHILASEVAALTGRLCGSRVFASDLGGGGWNLSARLQTSKWFHGHLHISEYSRSLSNGSADTRHHVILGGIDTETFSPDNTIAREPLVLFVGRLMPHKGVDDLIIALPPGLTLELIGKPYHEAFHVRLKELAVGKQVIFRTDCTDADVIKAYRRALCVVLPSVYRDHYGNETKVPELLGQTPLEGMACGCPAIVTDVASLPEVVEDKVCGFIVPPNNPDALREKLEWLRDHPDDARQMGAAGRQRVLEGFTWASVVQRCLDVYSS